MSKTYVQSAIQIAAQLKNRQLTVKAVVSQVLDRIRIGEPRIKAYLDIFNDEALAAADQVDRLYDKGDPLPPLAGIPIAIKDNICMKGKKTTCASKMLENFVSPYDATVIKKLAAHHLIPVGKTNMDEFAMGSSTENSAFFPTRNPWDESCVPGGSSGGSAAAVAAGEAILSIGSDTGGSIRQPASFCGLVGMKPTYGRVSRFGLVAFASSLDQIGPITRTVEDSAHLLNAICGYDSLDATSSDQAIPDFAASLNNPIQGRKLGVPRHLFDLIENAAIKESLVNALDVLKSDGVTWEFVDINAFDYAVATYYIVAPAEASANLSRFDGVRYGHRAQGVENLAQMYKQTRGQGFGPEVKRRIILGTYALSSGYYDAYYLKAQKARTLVKEEFNRLFAKYDAIVTPTTPTLPFKFGEHANNPLAMYLSDISTIPINLAGLPAISVPCGFSEGLPMGLQLIGKPYDESTLLNIAHQYQSQTNHHLTFPSQLEALYGV